MKPVILDPNDSQIKLIYESYRVACEPDSPSVCFDDLTQDQVVKTINNMKKVSKIVEINGQEVGFVTVYDLDSRPSINLGFGIFEPFRGKGLIVPIIKETVQYIKNHFPRKPITAATRSTNIAAIKGLEKAGFQRTHTELKPPIGRFKEPIEYVCFEYPDLDFPRDTIAMARK